MLKPLGESHSNKKIVKVAAWIATTPTSIQEAVSKGSKNAVGEIIPVRFATRTAIPVSINGTLKSTWKRFSCLRPSLRRKHPKKNMQNNYLYLLPLF